MRKRALIAILLVIAMLGGLGPSGSAFEIDKKSTFFPDSLLAHLGPTGGHEAITKRAIELQQPDVDPDLIRNLQYAVENTDITHQFDSESHFDNSSIPLSCTLGSNTGVDANRPCNTGFEEGFATIGDRFNKALELATGNAQFKKPFFKTYRDIVDKAGETFADLALSGKCIKKRKCPTTYFAKKAVVLKAYEKTLALNPNPDPHEATGERSIFIPGNGPAPIGDLAADLAKYYRDVIKEVDDLIIEALGRHNGQLLEKILGSDHPQVEELKKVRKAIKAYRAFQFLGHAIHSTQDFFAHSNYVELMAGVEPGTPIQTVDTPVPATWKDFSVEGIRTLMGPGKFGFLQTGQVLTFWLGEGDACGGNNLFNPIDKVPIQVSAVQLAGVPSIAAVIFNAMELGSSFAGTNRGTTMGFEYCHYDTRDAQGVGARGLNKDHTCKIDGDPASCEEPQMINYYQARLAAQNVTQLLWKEFLAKLDPSEDDCGGLAVTMQGTVNEDQLIGTSGVDVIHGGDGDDRIFGMEGNDMLCGGKGNDVLDGGLGDDLLDGGANDDPQIGTADPYAAPGDWAWYFDVTTSMNVDLDAETATGYGNDSLSGIENVQGGFGSNTILGDAEDNVLIGCDAFDGIVGHGGDDRIVGLSQDDNLQGDGIFGDDLIGEPGDDILEGGPGNDSLNPGPGKDTVDGGTNGAGTFGDTVSYLFVPGPMVIDIGGSATGWGSDTLIGVESVAGGDFNDVITGDENDNDIEGFDGDDQINSGGGDDWLDGGNGTNTGDAGAGENDRCDDMHPDTTGCEIILS